jgi:Kef-type K+ transport system membrane component KefB
MFSIGLEFSLTRLVAMRRLVFGLGGAQVLVTMAATTAVATGFGLSWEAGVALGGALAMSSTAIVGKLLSEKFELHSLSGRQTMGVLLFQDLAVVPLLILYPALAAEGAGFVETLGLALLKATVALALVMVVGQRLVRRWMDAVVRRKSSELFVLNVLWLTVGLAYLTKLAGLSLSIGAFLAGMLISETVYRHQVEADIRPFRDVPLGLFSSPSACCSTSPPSGRTSPGCWSSCFGLVTVKGLLVMALSVFLRNNLPTALKTAGQLAQAGEFGFVLNACRRCASAATRCCGSTIAARPTPRRSPAAGIRRARSARSTWSPGRRCAAWRLAGSGWRGTTCASMRWCAPTSASTSRTRICSWRAATCWCCPAPRRGCTRRSWTCSGRAAAARRRRPAIDQRQAPARGRG